ncbi:MAG TPA: hypothetical protein VN843_24100 [Anaerolineales bacterium]|nr:hypothetical protein [Anaerolineales bacterium]
MEKFELEIYVTGRFNMVVEAVNAEEAAKMGLRAVLRNQGGDQLVELDEAKHITVDGDVNVNYLVHDENLYALV